MPQHKRNRLIALLSDPWRLPPLLSVAVVGWLTLGVFVGWTVVLGIHSTAILMVVIYLTGLLVTCTQTALKFWLRDQIVEGQETLREHMEIAEASLEARIIAERKGIPLTRIQAKLRLLGDQDVVTPPPS